MMVGLEPCDEAKIVAPAEFAKPDEGMHLVLVAANLFRKGLHPDNIGIGCRTHQARVRPQSPKQAIQQRKALRITIEDRGFCELHESSGHVE